MEIGIYTFGNLFADRDGSLPSAGQRLRAIVKLAKLADELGLDVFAVGEHHRPDMAVSSPAVVLAAVAQATAKIRLSSATTVLSTLDPVRVFEDFATLDLLADGRAELLVGRGSFTENYGLFGYRLEDYDELFAEKLGLLLALNKGATVTWRGKFRPALHHAEISPQPERPLPIWVGVGGTPESAIRAGALGVPMNLAILAGPERFVPFAELHRTAATQAGHVRPKLAVSSHGHLADDG
ncbi:MAG: LLM class flavin-dependent oxidoreductase, partial [Candidatus Aenigmarchaeota archaeon]|nr:LLM class flavin-dependent oxidoreductase [Candidatus Aenigmarchaeota archaeon]